MGALTPLRFGPTLRSSKAHCEESDVFAALISFLEKGFGAGGEADQDIPHDALKLATATLLVEMARVDFQEEGPELERSQALLAERYGLTPREAEDLLETARMESDHAVSLFRFTHLINGHFDMPAKLGLMEMLWEVAYADGRLDKHEDALMHKLADLLYVPLNDLMAAKQKVRKKARER